MGSFDASTFDFHLWCARPLLGRDIDALQEALRSAAPGWSSKVRLASVGAWRVAASIDMSASGALGETIRRHQPGGSAWRPTHERDADYDNLVITGADAAGHLSLHVPASVGVKGATDTLWIEVLRTEIDGAPSEAWMARVFPAVCAALRPTAAAVQRLGEGMMVARHVSSRPMPRWLTWLAGDLAGIDPAGALAGIRDVQVVEHPGGVLIQLDPSSVAYRRKTYIERVRAVEAAIGRETLTARMPPTLGGITPAPPAAPPPSPPKLRISRGGRFGFGPRTVAGGPIRDLRVGGQRFTDAGGVLEDFDVERVEFSQVFLGPTSASADPVIVRRCRLRACRVRDAGFGFGPLVVEDCDIHGLDGTITIDSTPPLLRHVTVSGQIGGLYLRWARFSGDLRRRHAAHYATVDWALDIRAARFASCELSSVPGHLVRRDPASQVLVIAQRVRAASWRTAVTGTVWEIMIERLLEDGRESEALVACPRGKTFADDLNAFARLRSAGVAEPD